MIKKLKEPIINFLDNILQKYLYYRAKDSNYIKYAKNEFKLVYGDYTKDEMQNLMCEQTLNILSLLSIQGDSGFSIVYKLSLLNKLINFKPISKLTFEDDEFMEPYSGGNRQSRRDSSVFLDKNGTITYLNGFIKKSEHKYYKGIWSIGSKTTWNGSAYIVKDDGSIYRAKGSVIIKNKESFSGKTFYIPTYEIECPTDWWISFVKESDLKELIEEYDLYIIDSNLEFELNYKNGIYRNEILFGIKSMYELMGIEFSEEKLKKK